MNIKISYIWPHADTYRDGQFGTGITFVKGLVYDIPADIALRMLRHVDVYQRAEDVAKPDAVFTPAKRTPEDDERDKEDAAQDIRDAITQMDKVGLKTYIKTNWQQDIDGRLSVEAMRQKASALFDQFGLP